MSGSQALAELMGRIRAGQEQQSIAERFVDECTFLRVLRLTGDTFDYAYLGGQISTRISDVYGVNCNHVENDPAWLALGVDMVRTFTDGSIAIHFLATVRWEVYRTW